MDHDDHAIREETAQVEGLRIHYRTGGRGEPVLLVHGWPTSSLLWRNILPPLARVRRVVAPDLPGFGRSDKPRDGSYSLNYQARFIAGFLAALGIERTALVVHDLGGPIGLLWAVRNPERVSQLVVLNTLAYPEVPLGVKLFLGACFVPGLSHWLARPSGIARVMRMGVAQREALSPETVALYQEPFPTSADRKVLLKTVKRLHPAALREIAAGLPRLTCPVLVAYGKRDRLLPGVEKQMERLRQDLPQAKVVALDCGHFLQEDDPARVAELLVEFLGAGAERAEPHDERRTP